SAQGTLTKDNVTPPSPAQVTVSVNSVPGDGDTFELSVDGGDPIVFEFDNDSSVEEGHIAVDVSSADPEAIAGALAGAIDGQDGVSASSSGADVTATADSVG